MESKNTTLPVPVNERDHMIGSTDARVTVVNYGDYECPDCLVRHKQVEKVFDQLIHEVRYVYRHFPLIRVHPHALRAAQAAEVAAAQGKFWEMHRRLYAHPNKLGDRELRHHAQQIGLDMVRFDQEMATDTIAEQITKDYYNSIIYGISGAPTTFVNSVLYAMSGVELVAAVEAILKTQGPDSTEPGIGIKNS